MDFTADLKKFAIPTLVLHGDDDQIVPFADSALRSAKLIRNAKQFWCIDGQGHWRHTPKLGSKVVSATNCCVDHRVRTRTAVCEFYLRARYLQTVMAAVLNDFKPNIEEQRRLIAR